MEWDSDNYNARSNFFLCICNNWVEISSLLLQTKLNVDCSWRTVAQTSKMTLNFNNSLNPKFKDVNKHWTKEREDGDHYNSNSKSRPLTSISRHNESCIFSTHNRVRTDCHIFHHYSIICMFVCITKTDQRQLIARRSIVKTWHDWNARKKYLVKYSLLHYSLQWFQEWW